MAEPMAEADLAEPVEVVVENAEPHPGASRCHARRFYLALAVVLAGVAALSWYGGLKADLNSEYFNVARALARGEGFAHPFQRPTGPTAWVPPLLPLLLAGLLYAGGGSPDLVGTAVVVLQVLALAGTGVLVLTLARQTTRRLGPVTTAVAFLLGAAAHCRICFSTASVDGWLSFIVVGVLLAGLCRARPLGGWKRAVAWGFFGGVAALVNPVVAFAWGVMSAALAVRRRAWSPLALAFFAAALTLAPWAVRNYLVFGRLIPVKSNLAYELYQSQCLQPAGMLRRETLEEHPYHAARAEGREYRALGETEYLDRKRGQFWQAVRDDPEGFLNRVADRFLGATLWYEPFNRAQESRRPYILLLARVIHPLPFLALVFLAFRGIASDLPWGCWSAIGVYLLAMLPYFAISYYERYGLPLLGVKVLLVLWAVDELLAVLRPGFAGKEVGFRRVMAPSLQAGDARDASS